MTKFDQLKRRLSAGVSLALLTMGHYGLANAARSAGPPVAELEQLVAKPGDEADVRDALLGEVQPTRTKLGNVGFDVLVSKDNPAQFFVWGLWKTEAAADAHDRSPPEFHVRQHLLAPPSFSRAHMLSSLDTSPGKKHPVGSPDQLTLVPFFIAKEGQAKTMRIAHLQMIQPTRSEPGNIDYDLFASDEDPKVMFFFENWNNKGALAAHMAKPYFTQHVRGQADAAAVVPWTYLTLQMISLPAFNGEKGQ
jgi:quinol monooxygenase YgiN